MTPTWHGTWHINSTRVFQNPRKQRTTNPFAHLIHHNSIGSTGISQDQSIRKPFIVAANGRLNHFSLHRLVQGPVWFNAIKGQCGVKMSFGVQNFNIMQYCYFHVCILTVWKLRQRITRISSITSFCDANVSNVNISSIICIISPHQVLSNDGHCMQRSLPTCHQSFRVQVSGDPTCSFPRSASGSPPKHTIALAT